jgi:two-component system, chemotaxis family, response regulator Rcp1
VARATDLVPFEVLLVEDNPGDVDLVLEVLAKSSTLHRVSVAPDGEDALARLHKEGAYAGARSPDLILLDLNLPKKDGREVLANIKQHPALRHIPVVILSSSGLERDLLETYRMHANCFVTKPADLEEYWSAVRDIERFWLGRACLPNVAS